MNWTKWLKFEPSTPRYYIDTCTPLTNFMQYLERCALVRLPTTDPNMECGETTNLLGKTVRWGYQLMVPTMQLCTLWHSPSNMCDAWNTICVKYIMWRPSWIMQYIDPLSFIMFIHEQTLTIFKLNYNVSTYNVWYIQNQARAFNFLGAHYQASLLVEGSWLTLQLVISFHQQTSLIMSCQKRHEPEFIYIYWL